MANPSQATDQIVISGLPRTLIAKRMLDELKVREILNKSKESKKNFIEVAVEEKAVKALDVAMLVSKSVGLPIFDIASFTKEHQPDTQSKVDIEYCRTKLIAPLILRGNTLFIAIADPNAVNEFDEIKFKTSHAIEAVVVEVDKLIKLIESGEGAGMTQMDDIEDDLTEIESDQAAESTQIVEAGVDDTPVVKFVNRILLDAIQKGASDIHFEPYEKFYRVRYRIDGELKEISKPKQQMTAKITARVKVISNMDISERRVPQDGRIKLKISSTHAIDFRVNSCPTIFGEKLCLRILDASSAMLGIEALGYEDKQKDAYLKALDMSEGMILVTGPTGSGKTVSLYTGLNILNQPNVNISTAEDPAEINLPGINQVNMNNKAGLDFSSTLRAFLRQDPDVIMVGEIRDLETASIAIKAAQTGHLVLSTLHTNDAPQTLDRLANMGVPPFSIATAVKLIIAQRLARRLCKCKQPTDIPKDILIKEGFTEEDIASNSTIYKPVGCSICGDSGYKGRTGIYQVMPITDEISRLILKGGNSIEIADVAAKDGIADIRRSALLKVLSGAISLEEANSASSN